MDTTRLFSNVAENYASYRPSYPQEIFALLRAKVGQPASAVDVAAGTGIFTRHLQKNGFSVTAIEPNAAMRSELIKSSPMDRLSVVDGTAEATGLEDHSTNLITIAQAFHWVEPKATRTEFQRIGTTTCLTAVVWNSRNFTATPFMRDYKSLLDNFAPAYKSLKNHWSNLDDRVKDFFQGNHDFYRYENLIIISEDEMIGNLLSLSYAPPASTEDRDNFIKQAQIVFNNHQQGGKVLFDLTSRLYVGNLL